MSESATFDFGTDWEIQTPVTIDTFDQSDEKPWPDQQKYNDKDNDKYIKRTPTESDLWDLFQQAFILGVNVASWLV